ncbi:hypothetical protein NXS19_000499 [Fusarium pseudograminearum]|nr:hypothetical protein NXS19_000499 [Fusarium pseudograminearum]
MELHVSFLCPVICLVISYFPSCRVFREAEAMGRYAQTRTLDPFPRAQGGNQSVFAASSTLQGPSSTPRACFVSDHVGSSNIVSASSAT